MSRRADWHSLRAYQQNSGGAALEMMLHSSSMIHDGSPKAGGTALFLGRVEKGWRIGFAGWEPPRGGPSRQDDSTARRNPRVLPCRTWLTHPRTMALTSAVEQQPRL